MAISGYIRSVSGRIFLVFFGCAAWASANQTVYDTIRKAFPSASPLLIILLGTTAVFILGFVVAWEIFKTDKQKKEKVELSWQNFGELVTQKALNLDETKLLKKLIMAGDQVQADVIFSAPQVYENCVDAFLSHIIKTAGEENVPYDILTPLRKKMGFSTLPVETPLSSTKQINPGQFVTLHSGKGRIPVKAAVSEVTEKYWMLRSSEALLNLPPGQQIEVNFIRGGDAEYRLAVKVIECDSQQLIAEHTSSLDRKQLRNWVRVDVNIPCRVVLTKKGPSETGIEMGKDKPLHEGASLNGRIMDISGGGVSLRLARGLPKGSLISMNFDLPGASLNNVTCEVISYNPVPNSENSQFLHRLKFSEIDTAIQEKIVRFVFEKNRMDSQFRQ